MYSITVPTPTMRYILISDPLRPLSNQRAARVPLVSHCLIRRKTAEGEGKKKVKGKSVTEREIRPWITLWTFVQILSYLTAAR